MPRTRGAPRDCIAPLWRLGLGVGSDFERGFMVLPREIELRVFFESTYDILVENRIYEKKFHSGKKLGVAELVSCGGIITFFVKHSSS